jgi:predicted chitinase
VSVRTGFLANGVAEATAIREAPLAEAAMRERDITTQQRAAMFLAQVLEESGNLAYFEEIASGQEYEGRSDLGNTHPGDGPLYKGRGPIQLTGRANYRWAGARLGLPLEQHPELAAQHAVGWRIAALYWQSHGLNELADEGAFLTITKRINGGTNGYSIRLANLNRVKRVDCRPTAPRDSLWFMTATERRWAHEYDRLLAHHQDPARRRALRHAMTDQRKRVWRAAQGHGGWTAAHRAARYRALKARTS